MWKTKMQLQLVHRCFDTLRARFRTHAEDMHLHMREQCWVVVDTEECVAPATAHVIVFHGADNQTTTRTKMTRTPWKTYIPHIPHHPSTLTLCTEFAERTSRTLKVDSLNIMELFPLEDMTCVVHKFIGTVMDLSWTLPRQRWVYDAKQVLLPIFQGACKTTTIL